MNLTLWRPTRPVRTFPSLFDDNVFDRLFQPFVEGDETWVPPVDLIEQEGTFVILADLPGMEKKDIHIEVKNGVLYLSGERKDELEEKAGAALRMERRYGTFSRHFHLSEHVDSSEINAEYKNGTLKITLPKAERAKTKQIPIQVN